VKDANRLLIEICQRAVSETPLPPVPPELLNGAETLEDEITFNLY
jgi:hypothetical protein